MTASREADRADCPQPPQELLAQRQRVDQNDLAPAHDGIGVTAEVDAVVVDSPAHDARHDVFDLLRDRSRLGHGAIVTEAGDAAAGQLLDALPRHLDEVVVSPVAPVILRSQLV